MPNAGKNEMKLLDFQKVNGFENSNLITSKINLCKSLKNLPGEYQDNFFPESFSITNTYSIDKSELDSFKQGFRFT